MIRACVAGVGGKMGSRILNALRAEEDFVVTGAFEKPESPHVGLDAGLLSGAGPLEVTIQPSIEKALENRVRDANGSTGPPGMVRHPFSYISGSSEVFWRYRLHLYIRLPWPLQKSLV